MKNSEPIEDIEVPDGVKVSLEDNVFVVVGPKGEIRKRLAYPTIVSKLVEGKIQFFVTKKFTKREKKLINTYLARIKNYFRGVKEGHTYRLKICSGHFPMSVSVKGQNFEVKNFVGENTPRLLKLKSGVAVTVNGDEVLVEGIDKERVSQTAADIETLTRRPGFDKRVFMDGIWIVEKDGERLA